MTRTTYLQAIRQAMIEEMERDERLFLMGQDVASNVFGSTERMVQAFGRERVRDTPISEAATVGAAAGASMVGMRPIVDINISSFLYPAMDQLISIVAKSRYVYGGQARLPLLVRACLFYGNGFAAQHSDRAYSMFMNVPGLKIIAPSSPRAAKGLIKAAIRDDNPVLCFEDRNLWASKEEVPDDPDFVIPIGRGEIKRAGTDLTIIALSGAVPLAMKAADLLARDGISAEVIDPRTLCPLDTDIILQSVRRTGRAVTVDPAHRTCSAGSEIAAMIGENAFHALRGPVRRIATPDTHIPFNVTLEKALFPTAEKIVAVARDLVGLPASAPLSVEGAD
ncbi:MAG: alpha-ketoacid dehydrogenase subunit beta [Bradyrhizobium sp.]|nr:alpha-ketoacid dehydrogenase subunit beta [Bradyrhizobium sp.]